MTNLITKKNLAVSVWPVINVVSVSVVAESLGVNSLYSIKSSSDKSFANNIFANNTYRKTLSIGTDRLAITAVYIQIRLLIYQRW